MSKQTIIGAGGGGKGGGGEQRAPVEAPDSLRSKAFAKIIDLVSEGEIEGLVNGLQSIYLDGTPIQNSDGSFNFSGIEVVTRDGTQAQTAIPGQTGVENVAAVAVKVTAAASVTRQVTNSNIDAVRVTIGIPQLSSQNTSTGDLNGTSVQIAIDLQSNGGGFNQVITDSIVGKTTTRYQRSYRVELTGSGPWDIRVRRITADSTSVTLQNQTWWDSYTEIIDAKLRYPNSALIGMKVDSSQFQSIPTRGYDLKLLRVKVPSNYNPTTRAYTGSWDGTFQIAWTDNPAWCFYDLVTSDRYGLGGLVDTTQVDKWALYQIGKYCDELVDDGKGGTEPRFTCNMYLQTRADAFRVLQDMASIFRGMVYWATGAVTATQDAPSDAVALFTAANVIGGKFNYTGSSLKARHTVALVTWNDPEDLYRQKVEYVEDVDGIARYGVQQTEITAMGCTSQGQANRVGRWLLYSERFETETVQFQVGLEGAVVRPGHIIKVADATRANARLGGRVVSATTTTVTLDAVPSLGSSVWTMYCQLADGTIASSQVATASGAVVTLSTALASAPQAQSIWVLSATTVEAQTFRVVSVGEEEGGTIYTIAALKHEPLKYDAIEQGLVLQPRDYTLLNDIPATPTGFVSSESLYRYQAEVRSRLTIGWAAVSGAYKYVVEWRKDSGNWTREETQAADFDLLNTTPGAYDFKIYAQNPAGLLSSPLAGSVTALGKTAPPADVTSITAVVDPAIGVTLTWPRVADLDVDVYEVRSGASWAAGTLVGQVYGTQLKIGLLATGAFTYWVKALDTSGQYSANAATTTVTIAAPGTPSVTVTQAGDTYTLSWTSAAGSLATANYVVKYGASYATGTTVASVNSTSLSVPINWLGARTYWVAAVDVAGTASTAGSAAVTVVTAGAPTVAVSFAGESAILSWGAVQGTLATVEYEVRYGASYAAGVTVARIKGTALQTRANWSGARTYWVAAIDSGGNTGTAGSVVATVNAPVAPTVTSAFTGENVVLTWGAVQGTMPTDYYEIRYGASFAAGTLVGTIKATTTAFKAQWSGTRTFWVAAVDINGTTGTAGSTTATVSAPVSVTVTQEVIDNNVLLKWGDGTATLPVDYYELRKGSSWAGATVIGRASARFATIFESSAGTFTYWVAGTDVAGNVGTPSSVNAQVSQPPDYALQYNQDSAFGGTLTNIAIDTDGSKLAPVSTTETWQSHFTSRSWSTPQDQITAGYPIYSEPSQTAGSYEETIDYGTVLAATKITTTLSYTVVTGTPVVTPTISVKKLAGDPWTDYVGQSSAFVTDFRYVKVRYDIASVGGDDLVDITGLNVRFDVKLRNDAGTLSVFPSQSATYSQTGTTITVTYTAHGRAVGQRVDLSVGSGTATSGEYVITGVTANTFTVTSATSATTSGNVTLDPNGTPTLFNVSFVDVQSITVTPGGTTAAIAIYNFVDAPNPTGFKALLFNTSGTRINGSVGWSAKGV